MNRYRCVVIAVAYIITAGQLPIVDFTDLNWSKNAGSYLGIISMVFIIATMVWSSRHDEKGEE